MFQLRKASVVTPWISVPDWSARFPGKKKNKVQSVSCSGLGWIKQRLLQGLIKFGGLFKKARLKICFLKLCPNTPCELPVPPFCPVLSPVLLCNAAFENCTLFLANTNLDVRGPGWACFSCPCSCFVNKLLWKSPVLWGNDMKDELLLLPCLSFFSPP